MIQWLAAIAETEWFRALAVIMTFAGIIGFIASMNDLHELMGKISRCLKQKEIEFPDVYNAATIASDIVLVAIKALIKFQIFFTIVLFYLFLMACCVCGAHYLAYKFSSPIMSSKAWTNGQEIMSIIRAVGIIVCLCATGRMFERLCEKSTEYFNG